MKDLSGQRSEWGPLTSYTSEFFIVLNPPLDR